MKGQLHSAGGFVVFLVMCLGAQLTGSFLTFPAIRSGWHAGPVKPFFNPPGWVFGPVCCRAQRGHMVVEPGQPGRHRNRIGSLIRYPGIVVSGIMLWELDLPVIIS